MNKKELVRAVCERLKDENVRKPICIPKHSFFISDNEGNTKEFQVKRRDKTVMYSVGDVEAIVDACLDVVSEMVKAGEEVNVHGFGVLNVIKRAERSTITPNGDKCVIEAHYVPKFTAGKRLRMAAKLYELNKGGE